MRPIRIGAQVPPQHATFAQLRAAFLAAEQAGADAVYTWDHFFPLSGDPDGTHFECWSLLAAMAEATRRVQIGPLVTPIAYRNPNLLADIARTVDHISGGRVMLGLGAGWFERDYDEYGFPFKTGPERARDLAAALPVIQDRLARLNPPPVQAHLPLMVAGRGEKVMLRLVAQYADIWNGFGDPTEAGRLSGIIDDWCAREGRDPAAIERSILNNSPVSNDMADDYVANNITFLLTGVNASALDLRQLESLVAWRDQRNAG